MEAKMLIDYLTFTIKPASEAYFGLDFVLDFLGFDQEDFTFIGARMHYAKCYVNKNDVKIYESSKDRMNDMGICVSMSGQGCRYFESHLKDGEICENAQIWVEFFRRLRGLLRNGYAVNVSRIDIAVDDKSCDENHLLDLDLIESSANCHEFVSQFRRMEDFSSRRIMSGKITGRTLSFGSRKSAAYCRFYDKLAEQRSKHSNDKERLKELDGITHWVRMEFEFKRKQAVKIVNAICDASDFSLYYAKLVNGYVRFVEPDDENVTRCTVKPWWRRFIGTIKSANLSTGDFKPYGFGRICHYYSKYLSTTIFTIMSRLSPSEFFDMTCQGASGRLKKKHRMIIDGKEHDVKITMSDWWNLLNPIPIGERVFSCAM